MSRINHDIKPTLKHKPGITLQSNIQVGYTCPPGWWKYREGKEKMCCHWVYQPGRGYVVDCTT